MGIQGLLPFLKKASRQSNVKEFKGCTVAIDSYCWLHRGAFACAEKLALGEKTDQLVVLCLCLSTLCIVLLLLYSLLEVLFVLFMMLLQTSCRQST